MSPQENLNPGLKRSLSLAYCDRIAYCLTKIRHHDSFLFKTGVIEIDLSWVNLGIQWWEEFDVLEMIILCVYIDVILSQFEKLHHLETGYIERGGGLTVANFLDNVVWFLHQGRNFDPS
jgi:hypothetical protein